MRYINVNATKCGNLNSFVNATEAAVQMAFAVRFPVLLVSLSLQRISAQMPLPYWSQPFLDPLIFPYGGATLVNGTKWTRLYFGLPGAMNAMAPMISYLGGAFLASWKLSPLDEDAPGQHVMYSRSTDGLTWSQPAVLFPPLNSSESPRVALFAEPTIMLGGRVYAAASPQQFCLYPVQQSPRLVLLRRIGADGSLGTMFWAAPSVPDGYLNASASAGVVALPQMDAITQADVALLTPTSTTPPCDTTGATTKCEACAGGCQPWADAFNASKAIENERTHYIMILHDDDGRLQPGDAIFYRSRENRLYASLRSGGPSERWSIPRPTNITDAISNINAGNAPDGSVFLVSNAMIGVSRDPLFISLSRDGMAFDHVGAIGSCGQDIFANPPEQPDGCIPRVNEGAISGLQYPQAAAVASPASVAALWVIVSQNREDIWVAKVGWDAIAAL